MEKTTTRQHDDRIRFFCTSHPTQLPIVTMHEEQWAYCPGGYVAAREGHTWTAIEPTSVYYLKPAAYAVARAQRAASPTA